MNLKKNPMRESQVSKNLRSLPKVLTNAVLAVFAVVILGLSQWLLYSLLKDAIQSEYSPEFMKTSPGLWAVAIMVVAFVLAVFLMVAAFTRSVSAPSSSPESNADQSAMLSLLNRRAESQKLTAALLGLVAVVFNKYVLEPNILHSFAVIITSGGAVLLVISSTRGSMLVRSHASKSGAKIIRTTFDYALALVQWVAIAAIAYLVCFTN
jgi:hypothetical protein